jgi:hypothetical protein
VDQFGSASDGGNEPIGGDRHGQIQRHGSDCILCVGSVRVEYSPPRGIRKRPRTIDPMVSPLPADSFAGNTAF